MMMAAVFLAFTGIIVCTAAPPSVHSSSMCALPPTLALPGGATVDVVGDGATAATLHRESAFELRVAWGNGRPIRDAIFQARLVGPSMLAAVVRPPANRDAAGYAVTYTVHDPGTYVLEVRVSWLTGASMEHLTLPLNPTDFLNNTTHVECVVYRREFVIADAAPAASHEVAPLNGTALAPAAPAASASSASIAAREQPKPLCRTGNRPGRWVRVAPGATCPPHACVGSASSLAFLDDLYGFNRGWVWAPYDCNYRIYSVPEFEQCLVRKNVSQLGFVGDSLLREHFQNVMVFLQQRVPAEAKEYGSKANDQLYNLTLPGGWRVIVDYHLWFDDRKYDGHYRPSVNGSFYPSGMYDAQLWNLHMLRYLVQQKPADMARPAGLRRLAMNDLNKAMPRFLQPMEWLRRRRWSPGDYAGPRVPTVYYLHPRIQREDLRIVRDATATKIEGFAMMTPPRQVRPYIADYPTPCVVSPLDPYVVIDPTAGWIHVGPPGNTPKYDPTLT